MAHRIEIIVYEVEDKKPRLRVFELNMNTAKAIEQITPQLLTMVAGFIHYPVPGKPPSPPAMPVVDTKQPPQQMAAEAAMPRQVPWGGKE